MSIRRPVLYVGLTFSLASLAFSFGGWVTQRQMAQQLAANDVRFTALRDEMARSIVEMRAGGSVPLPSGTKGQIKPDIVLLQEMDVRQQHRKAHGGEHRHMDSRAATSHRPPRTTACGRGIAVPALTAIFSAPRSSLPLALMSCTAA